MIVMTKDILYGLLGIQFDSQALMKGANYSIMKLFLCIIEINNSFLIDSVTHWRRQH